MPLHLVAEVVVRLRQHLAHARHVNASAQIGHICIVPQLAVHEGEVLAVVRVCAYPVLDHVTAHDALLLPPRQRVGERRSFTNMRRVASRVMSHGEL